ncbi:MAG: PA-phosphatase [Actinomycetota bacterium]|nr:PA-phosphatase [Actinomycetota bacterium]
MFTDGRVSMGLWALVLVVALYRRRWRLAAVTAAAPFVAVLLARLAKRLFGRYKDVALAYPSGHTTLAVVVLGMGVLVAGAAAWAIATAVAATTLAVVGQGVTYHYFTDAVGAVFLGTALVCVAALIVAPARRLDGCQPGCDVDHSGG